MEPKKDLLILRHSAAHLLAHAVSELYPGTQMTIGPATEDGFFYDFLPLKNFKEEDLSPIQERMFELAKKNYPLEHKQISKDEARKLYKDNPFKLELINEIPGDTVGLAVQGDFYDLCRGGHVKSTGELMHVALLGVAGSYWRADRNKQPLQRITGTAFWTKKELDEFLQNRSDALTYDHRKLGKQLDLFSFHDEGIGFPFYHAKGKAILNTMVAYMRNVLLKQSNQEIQTPIMLNADLWRQSGHWQFYKDNMYLCHKEDVEYAVKPMNCPGSILIYQERPRSYRELPLRLMEFGIDHRFELSGALHGLFRTRAFTMDDTHIYCTLDQIEEEILNNITIIKKVLRKYGFENLKIALSTKPDEALGSPELWEKAETFLKNALNRAQVDYALQEKEGAFYGPKIEFKFKDAMNREWQCGTLQLDFNFPERFDLSYIAPTGNKERPVMIHRAIYGSLERFLAILLEHYRGNFPFWLSPVQIRVMTITDDQHDYAKKVFNQIQDAGFRVDHDLTSDQISAKIKTAQLEKIPWMIIIGKKEVEKSSVSLRYQDGKQELGIELSEVITRAHKLVHE